MQTVKPSIQDDQLVFCGVHNSQKTADSENCRFGKTFTMQIASHQFSLSLPSDGVTRDIWNE